MQNQSLKNFWIRAINDLKMHKGVAPNLIAENHGDLTDATWQGKMNNLKGWSEITNYAFLLCEDIFNQATANIDAWPGNHLISLLNYLHNIRNTTWGDWMGEVWNACRGYETEITDTQNHLRVDNLRDLTTEAKFQIPLGFSLEDVLKWIKEFEKVFTKHLNVFELDPVTNLPTAVSEDKIDALIEAKDTIDNITPHLGGIDLNGLATVLSNENKTLVDAFQEIGQLNQAVKTILAVNVLPNDYANQLNTLKTNSDEYTRIHTKLSGKVSDTELTALINSTPPPQCSHSDYDTIKSERDNLKSEQDPLKSENTQLKENYQQLISELGLAENSDWQSILAKVKELMKTPDSSDKDNQITQLTQEKSQLETQLKDKENLITELQAQKPTEEIKSQVIESSKQLGLFSSEFQRKLGKVNSYQELVKVQEEEFSYRLNKEISDKKSAGNLNIVLGVITFGSLVVLGWVLLKRVGLPELEKKEK